MRMLIAGDLSGRAGSGDSSATARGIDLDNFDAVLRRIAPRVTVAAADGLPATSIEFTALDDFHPDRLFATLPVFSEARAMRARLNDPATAAAESARLLTDGLLGKPAPPATPTAPSATATHPAGLTDSLIRRFVQPHIVSAPARDSAPLVAALDAATSEAMRRIVHDRGFQRLEASWRGVRWLVENLELGEDLELAVADVARPDLPALLSDGLGDDPASVVVGLDTFGAGPDDLQFLASIAPILERRRVFLLSAADAALATGPDSAEWQGLRRATGGQRIALAYPGWLMRLPYGAATEPAESFAFEECAGVPGPGEYLWGHPAIVSALVAGQAWLDHQWEEELPGSIDLTDLPAHVVERDGERVLQPCVSAALGADAAEAVARRGITALAGLRNRNALRILPRFRLG